jgi:hypothetical protein
VSSGIRAPESSAALHSQWTDNSAAVHLAYLLDVTALTVDWLNPFVEQLGSQMVPNTGAGTRKSREAALLPQGRYAPRWRDFSTVDTLYSTVTDFRGSAGGR